MITVAILINNKVILAKSAVRIAGNPGEMCTYDIYGGPRIQHHYDNGAIELCKMILDSAKDELPPPPVIVEQGNRADVLREKVFNRLKEIRASKQNDTIL